MTTFLAAGPPRGDAPKPILSGRRTLTGDRPFRGRDKSANFWPLAILSMGESRHNSHHTDPTRARHGVRRGQFDISARLIRLFEKLGRVWQVRRLTPQRPARLTNPRNTAVAAR